MSRLNCLSVKVERATGNPRSPFARLFENPVKVDESFSVPFETLTAALRFMYGDDVVVSFSSQILTLKKQVIMKTKWILIVLKALIQCILDSMKEMEKSGDVDADGVPFSEEYHKQGFILAKLREITNDVELNCDNHEE